MQVVYTMVINNNHILFHLWSKNNLVKQKVSKYYQNDCRIHYQSDYQRYYGFDNGFWKVELNIYEYFIAIYDTKFLDLKFMMLIFSLILFIINLHYHKDIFKNLKKVFHNLQREVCPRPEKFDLSQIYGKVLPIKLIHLS